MSYAAPRRGKFKARPVSTDGTFFGCDSSPVFHESTGSPPLHPQIIKQARKSGQLNLTNRGFKTVPSQVWNINNLTEKEVKTISVSMDDTDDRWWDQVDLTRLILANNSIAEISADIRNLVALVVLDLHDNHLNDLPESLGELRNITTLNISHNQFTEVPLCIFKLEDLKSLFLQNNQIENLSEDISNCGQLEELNVSNNKLRTLPQGLGFLSKIMKLSANENKLVEIFHEIGGMAALRILDLSNNSLVSLPPSIGELSHLEQLYLRHNRLATLPIFQNANLKELYCGNNKISELTGEHLESLPGLKLLELRDNRLSTLPDEIIVLQGLIKLDLTNNQLTGLPSVLGVMGQLGTLSLEGNPMKSIRRDIIQRGTAHLLKFLRNRLEAEDPDCVHLKRPGRPVSNESIKAFEEASNIDQYALRGTRALQFSNKQATDIPDSLFEMAGDCEVTTINLSKNCLTDFPTRLEAAFPKLSELDIGFNYITAVPSFIGSASRLAFLDLRSNRLESLPQEMENLQMLREICISGNRFIEIPKCIYALNRLEIIHASDNRIREVNVEGLSRLSVITVLDLKNNDIAQVPPELGNLKQIRSLHLEGNTFRLPRVAILAKGTDAVMEYLRDRIPA